MQISRAGKLCPAERLPPSRFGHGHTAWGDILTVNLEAAEEELYCVQYSTGLKNWQTILEDQSGNAVYVETDLQRLAQPRLFYRAFRE